MSKSDLIFAASLIKRSLREQFVATRLGPLLLFGQPLALFLMYSLVFRSSTSQRVYSGVVIESQSLFLLLGILFQYTAAGVCQRSMGVIRQYSTFIKNINFDLRTLPVVSLVETILLQSVPICVIVLVCQLFSINTSPLPFLVLPLIIVSFSIPLICISYFLSCLAVFFPDLRNATALINLGFLFASPVFYNISQVSYPLQYVLWLNPLTLPITATREFFFLGYIQNVYLFIPYILIWGCLSYIAIRFYYFLSRGFSHVL